MTTISKKILVVDDEESIREIMKMGLDRLGYHSKFAKNGKEALEILDKEEFPLIITDIRMPEMGGIELCVRIKEKNPETFVYAFSGVVRKVDFDQLEKMGFDGLICKPFKFEVLQLVIKGIFKKINKKR
jgi:CheY-like chemotaxis protein